MKKEYSSLKEYIDSLPEERAVIVQKLRGVILENLPVGFEETISYNMIGYVVPKSIYPQGYHASKELPLPFINVASQKNHIAIYHMGLYSNKDLLHWFQSEYEKAISKKVDMGKSCIRFKKESEIPYELIGDLTTKISVEEWIQQYENIVLK